MPTSTTALHTYDTVLEWSGTTGQGYRTYSRTHRAAGRLAERPTSGTDLTGTHHAPGGPTWRSTAGLDASGTHHAPGGPTWRSITDVDQSGIHHAPGGPTGRSASGLDATGTHAAPRDPTGRSTARLDASGTPGAPGGPAERSTSWVELSADAAFRGDSALLNPEQLIVMAASSCQLLSFLAVAARAGVDVVAYADHARGTMPADVAPLRVTLVELAPVIRVAPGTDAGLVEALVGRAHDECYVAHSLTAHVVVRPTVVTA